MRRKSDSAFRLFIKKFERLGRRFLSGALAALFGTRKKYSQIPPAEIKRVLIFKIDDRLGNFILLSPFLTLLRQRLPQAEITYCAAAKMVPRLEKHPLIDKAYGFRKWAFWSPYGWPRMLMHLRKAHFDLAIDCSHPRGKSLTHALLTRFVGAKYTIGVSKEPFDSYYTSPVIIPPEIKSEMREYPWLLAPIGVNPQEIPALSYYPTIDSSAVSPDIAAWLKNPPGVIINMGAGTKDRFISTDFISQLAEFFEEEQEKTLLTWGPAEKSLALAALPNGSQYVAVAPPTNVDELYYLMAKAKLIISGDTGPMHLAIASGTPTIGLFVRGDPERFGHNYAPHKVIILKNSEEDLEKIKSHYLALAHN